MLPALTAVYVHRDKCMLQQLPCSSPLFGWHRKFETTGNTEMNHRCRLHAHVRHFVACARKSPRAGIMLNRCKTFCLLTTHSAVAQAAIRTLHLPRLQPTEDRLTQLTGMPRSVPALPWEVMAHYHFQPLLTPLRRFVLHFKKIQI